MALALNNLKRVLMPLNKETKPNQSDSREKTPDNPGVDKNARCKMVTIPMYLDGIKIFNKINTLILTIEIYSQDIRIEFAIEK